MSGRRHNLHRNAGSPEINIALVGSLGVGKSALTVKYITRRFIMEYDPDLEGTYTKHEDWDGVDVIINIMDTCDKDDTDASRYLKWADAFLVVYSITTKQSFEVARDYLETVTIFMKSQGRECPLALVGNKIDLERYRQVNKSDGTSLATEFDSLFYETTAAEEFELVERIFQRMVVDSHHDKYGHMLHTQSILSDDSVMSYNQQQTSQLSLKRPKSPKGVADKKDDKNNVHKKTLNKFFKIFN